MVDGINALDSKILTTTTVKTVGSGGDFATLNQAIDWCNGFLYINDGNIEISLNTGYVIDEAVYVEDSDLSRVTVKSVDTEVLVKVNSEWCINGRNSKMFKLGFILRANSSMYLGISLVNSEMEILNNCGYTHGAVNIQLVNSKILGVGIIKAVSVGNYLIVGKVSLNKDSVIKCGYLDCSRISIDNSTIFIDNLKVKEIVLNGSFVTNFTTFSIADTYTELRIKVTNCSNMYIGYNNSPIVDINVNANSRCLCSESLTGVRNVRSTDGSNLVINGITFSGTATVSNGSIISAKGSTGTLSQTANTITADGIIFK